MTFISNSIWARCSSSTPSGKRRSMPSQISLRNQLSSVSPSGIGKVGIRFLNPNIPVGSTFSATSSVLRHPSAHRSEESTARISSAALM
ncbi:hypothetical protein FHR32_005852 [Streptosporangium album]|uniref:Uncharacterized protein n=1 Tax=Streptosporangium album TaxID=47479 RepID=A0A7W7WCL8_9ACTN|nr:hypothetical protein [Streptosporangium album]